MKKFITSALIVLSIIACAQNPAIKTVSVANFEAGLKNKDIQILDVRTDDEYDGGHIRNALNIDVNETNFKEKIKTLDPKKQTYVYCLSGGRSKTAANILAKNGFNDILNLDGGIMAWKYDAKEVVLDKPITNTGMSMADFTKIITQDKPVLVEFYATWCGPCKILKPKVEALQEEYKDKINVIFIDVDKDKLVADELRLKSIPVLRYYLNGKQKFSITGVPNMKDLKKKMNI